MSKKNYIEVKCPGCGDAQLAPVWNAINVTLNPELKDQLLKGDVNTFSCKSCGEKSFLNTPLFYHDMKKQFCVQYFPPEYLDEASAFNEYNTQGKLSLGRAQARLPDDLNAYMGEPHVVFSMNEVARYILFRDILQARD